MDQGRGIRFNDCATHMYKPGSRLFVRIVAVLYGFSAGHMNQVGYRHNNHAGLTNRRNLVLISSLNKGACTVINRTNVPSERVAMGFSST